MRTLNHFGVYISKYEPVGLAIKYKKKEIKLSSETEQMAIAWVRKLETIYINDPVFVSNFTRSFVKEISSCEGYSIEITAKIADFDFSSIQDHLQKMKTRKEGMSKEERKLDLLHRKEVREKLKEKYGYASVDGLKIPLMNWTTEPSAIFMAKGLNKFRGCWKRSVTKKDITLNLSKDAPIPNSILKWKEEDLSKEPLTQYLGVEGLYLSKILKQHENISKRSIEDLKEIQKLGKNFLRKGDLTKINMQKNTERTSMKFTNDGMQGSEKNKKLGSETIEENFTELIQNFVSREGLKQSITNSMLLQNLEGDAKTVERLILEFLSYIIESQYFDILQEKLGKDLEIGLPEKREKILESNVLIAIRFLTTVKMSIDSPWKETIFDNKGLWIAKWPDKFGNGLKYVWFAQSTQLRQEKERKKFELALKLQNDMERLEVIIERELDEGTLERRKIATVVYLMKNLALRVGDEKIAGEYGTVGCTTLKKENVRIEGNTVHLSFRGKDFVQWDKSMVLTKLVMENLKEFLSDAKDDFIFKGINSEKVASFLRELTPGVSAKVFRTCIAGSTWEENADFNLKMIHNETSREVKKYLFKMTNLEVAKKLNHKRALPKGYDERKERIRLKLEVESNKLKEMYSKETDPKKIKKQEEKTEKLTVSWDLITNTAEWNLGTSLASYISPEKVMHFVEESELELEDVYSKTLQEKYSWAIKRKEQ